MSLGFLWRAFIPLIMVSLFCFVWGWQELFCLNTNVRVSDNINKRLKISFTIKILEEFKGKKVVLPYQKLQTPKSYTAVT